MRETISLNGWWDFMPIYQQHAAELPGELRYAKEPVWVPSSWRQSAGQFRIEKYGFDPFHMFDYPVEWDEAESGVLHRTVVLNENQLSEKLILCFQGIFQQSYIYWNGELVAHSQEAYLPVEADITGKGRIGENELCVLCTSFNTCTIPSGAEKKTGLAGSWFHKLYRGIWQDADLLVIPKTNLADAEIVTSVREQRITVLAQVENPENRPLQAEAVIYDGEDEVKRFSAPVSAGSARLREAWPDPVLWDTENPHLYHMELRLLEDGREIDSLRERFGFREFWAEGQNFMLNGTRINLRGDSWHFQGHVQQTKEYALNWCRVCREYGVNSIRYHANPHPTYYLDAADEVGILIVDETAIYGSGKTMDAANPEYLENCRRHIRGLVRRDKNHPSVVIWSLQNEMRWVDGRDEYKKHVPELMDIFHQADHSGRLISLDGDNRLIDKAHTEVASLHYNIDGTINQWDRKTPLTIGEHGGLWYISPQNSSMYMGLDAYHDHETCAEGISIKEQWFMEYARRKEVSGISSFNFAHYFATSMPREDIRIDNPPRTIKKNSLTINNGLLPSEYPRYIPNVTCKYAAEGMRSVTIIPREYDHSFYDSRPIRRTLDVYNDTLRPQAVTLKMEAAQGGRVVWREEKSFTQAPGQYESVNITIPPAQCQERSRLTLTAELYHGERLMFTLHRDYSIYPAELKTKKAIDTAVCYFGNDADFAVIRALAPNCRRIENIRDAGPEKILVLGSGLAEKEQELHDGLYAFLQDGGRILILEQTGFSFGSMTINKKEFLRAHASEYTHPVFAGLNNDDFACWLPHAGEYGPDSFINSAFEKPVHGDFNILLECSFGDFNDGGDLWTPLLEYKTGQGAVLACQLEVMKHFAAVPQACVLVRNMLAYLADRTYTYQNTAVIAGETERAFLDSLGLVYQLEPDWEKTGLLIVSPEAAAGRGKEIRLFLEKGGRLLCLPAKASQSLSAITGLPAAVENRPTYQLWPDYTQPELRGVSVVDLFGMDKVGMSPREVTNRHVAEYTVSVPGMQPLAQSVEGTIWDDLFIDDQGAEYCKRALVAYKKELAEEPRCYIAKADKIIFSQFIADAADEKSVRVYTRLLANLGAQFADGQMAAAKGEGRYAVESMMSLPYQAYEDYDRAFTYYSDPEFSLNNLGEGLYGWMHKFERDPRDGFITLTGSAGKTMFVTCFVHGLSGKDQTYLAQLEANTDCTFYLNGQAVNGETVILKNGINRVFLLVRAGAEDARLRLIFKQPDGTCATDLLYRTTVDEVDPK